MRCIRGIAGALAVGLLAAVCVAAQPAKSSDPKVEKERNELRKASAETLSRLYKAQPKARAVVEGGHGYATFVQKGVKLFVSGSGRGKGMAVNNKTNDETFMKMLELQAGLGFGVKKFRLVFIFDTKDAFESFLSSGWEFGGQSSAAAKTGEGKGHAAAGAISIRDGVWVYQLTDKGVALEVTVKGSKYYKDDDLNK